MRPRVLADRERARWPKIRFAKPQTTFTTGEERPFPGGLANGDGDFRPVVPITKCGTELARNAGR